MTNLQSFNHVNHVLLSNYLPLGLACSLVHLGDRERVRTSERTSFKITMILIGDVE